MPFLSFWKARCSSCGQVPDRQIHRHHIASSRPDGVKISSAWSNLALSGAEHSGEAGFDAVGSLPYGDMNRCNDVDVPGDVSLRKEKRER
jgi:hypothetical protein